MTQSPVLGVLGGMGGLASAAFLTTVYRRNPGTREQEQPVVWLRSNPRIPDRTGYLLEGRHEELAAAMEVDLRALLAAGADRLVICCITAHAVWPLLSAAVRARTLSLLDTLFATPGLGSRRRLVFCTNGSQRLGVLSGHPEFHKYADSLIFPAPEEQAAVHDILYRLKRGLPPAEVVPALAAMAHRAGAQGIVAGCTEVHLLADAWPEGALDVIDPLTAIADQLPTLLTHEGPLVLEHAERAHPELERSA